MKTECKIKNLSPSSVLSAGALSVVFTGAEAAFINMNKPRSSDVWLNGGPINRDTFEKAVAVGQGLQKRNPYGSELHRKGYEIVRQATVRYFGEDKLGEYEL